MFAGRVLLLEEAKKKSNRGSDGEHSLDTENSGTWKCFKVTFPIFIIRSDIRYGTEISVISSQYLISICNLSFHLKVTIIFFKKYNYIINYVFFFFYFLIIVWTVKAKVTGCSWHEGTIVDKEIISYWGRWHWHTCSYLQICSCAHPPASMHTQTT